VLLIKTYVGLSKIHGLGCFTAQNLRKGQLIWVENPELDVNIPVNKVKKYPKSVQCFLKMYTFLKENSKEGVYILCGDDARYMNHSFCPNIIENPDGSGSSLTARDIKKGEEITCDYYSFDLEASIKLKGANRRRL